MKNRECKPIKNLFLKSDDEIIEMMHELTEPIYPILNEVRIKKKEYMPKEEKRLYDKLENEATSYFLFDKEDLDELISGIMDLDDEDDDEYEDEEIPFEIADHIDSIGTRFYWIDFYEPNKNEFIDKSLKLLQDIQFEFIRIYWSAFDIDEDFKEIKFFYDNYPKSYEEVQPSKKKKERNELYEKAYFYSKDNVTRAAKILKRFQKEKTAKINGRYIPSITTEDYSSDYGFVYFIRNKDIHKIGITQNMLQRMEQLKPDELLDSIRCSNYKELEREIHNEFKGCRIPQTEYFRLDKEEINKVHEMLRDKAR